MIRIVRTTLYITLFTLLSAITYAQSQPDVRGIRWGMTKAQVIKSETRRKPIAEEPMSLLFRGIEVAKADAIIEYKFDVLGKLKEATYYIDANPSTDLLYYLDFNAVQNRLEEKYGDKPKGGYL